ncbi:hypothetical protein C1645_738424 [Glomus cerebriforme]|uniref:Uncharacterized protein n=1 Tax=Glomus cerebriforme TaxID=658196 RepID=A0A397T0Y7_9GLOM|nr:hypothetical protein C1645_738424 [Glomus cerebriforme]
MSLIQELKDKITALKELKNKRIYLEEEMEDLDETIKEYEEKLERCRTVEDDKKYKIIIKVVENKKAENTKQQDEISEEMKMLEDGIKRKALQRIRHCKINIVKYGREKVSRRIKYWEEVYYHIHIRDY